MFGTNFDPFNQRPSRSTLYDRTRDSIYRPPHGAGTSLPRHHTVMQIVVIDCLLRLDLLDAPLADTLSISKHLAAAGRHVLKRPLKPHRIATALCAIILTVMTVLITIRLLTAALSTIM